MKFLRWCAVLPAGLLASVFAGGVFGFVARGWFGDTLGGFISGTMSTCGLLFAALHVAPSAHLLTCRVMAALGFLIGAATLVGSMTYETDEDTGFFFAIGASMAFNCGWCVFKPFTLGRAAD